MKIIRAIDALINLLVGLLCVVVLLVSGYSLWDNYRLHQQAQDPTLLIYKPQLVPDGEASSGTLTLEGQVAWLCIDGTYIDFPVMQGQDNFEYLNRDPYGQYRLCGSIFLDHRNTPRLTDGFSMIYGHHMDHYNMFGSLDLFATEVYFDNHRDGWMATQDGVFPLTLFAVAWGEGDDWEIFNPEGKSASDVLPYIRQHAVICRDYVPGSRIVALSTCAGETEMSRLIVFGMLGSEPMTVTE
ncbi:MAG: class B sortase [Clostridia bacterium]|nr:class B sortase [Clostridia bacterium]